MYTLTNTEKRSAAHIAIFHLLLLIHGRIVFMQVWQKSYLLLRGGEGEGVGEVIS